MMNSRPNLKPLLSLCSCLAVVACDFSSDDPKPVQLPVVTITYQVGFSSLQLVGEAPAPETATASADIYSAQDGPTTLNGTVTIEGDDPLSVTINTGYPGENGPVLVALSAEDGGVWRVPEDTLIDDAEFDRLNGSGYYVSVRYPDGWLRGQILRGGLIPATVAVDSDETVPAVASTGTATAGFLLDPNNGFIRLRMTTEGIPDGTGAGLYGAVAGARGEVFVSMERSRSNPEVWGTADINDSNAREFLTQEGAGFIITGASYFSLETTSNPDGELRGQLIPSNIDVIGVVLEDDQVVRAGDPVASTAEGTATLTWNGAFNQLSVAVNTDIADAVSVGMYQAAAGEIGPLVLSLTPNVMLPGNWFVQRIEISEDQAIALRADSMYVSVVTDGYPEGELRGQILLDSP